MSTSLSFLFDKNGQLRPEFLKTPMPQEPESVTTQQGRLDTKRFHRAMILQWRNEGGDRIPDWTKVIAAIMKPPTFTVPETMEELRDNLASTDRRTDVTARALARAALLANQDQETAGAGIWTDENGNARIDPKPPDPPLQEYTVILQDIKGAITWQYPRAASPEEAVEQAEDAWTVSIACIPGHHSNLAP